MLTTPRRLRLVRDDHIVGWAVEFPNGRVATDSPHLFREYPTLESFKMDNPTLEVQIVDRADHFIMIRDDQHRGGAWIIEHSDNCRVKGTMGDCLYTAFARDNINGSRVYPTGRFRMYLDEGHMVLAPVGD
jgi:hypothetical protein